MTRYSPRARSLALAAVAMMLLASCGSDGDEAPDASDDTTDATDDTTDDTDEAADDTDDAPEETDDAAAADGDFDPETYFEDKTIRFVTSSGPGGGTDTRIRTLASQLPRFMPGNPATQVSNVTPHVAGINFLWEAEPDGLTVGFTAAPPLEFEFFEGATWNTTEFNHIGSIDAACDNMLMMRGNLGYDSIEDVMGSDDPALITMTSAPTPADVEPVQLSTMLIADYLDLPLEVKRVAESGQGALNLAMEREEINFARYGSSWCLLPSQHPGWLEDGFLIPLLDVGTSGPGQMAPGVEERGERPPHVSELLTDDQMDEWTGLVAASRAGGNSFFLPPGTPPEIVEAWRDVFDEAFADEDFLDTIKVTYGGSDLKINTGEETTELFTNNRAQMERFQDQAESITEELVARYVN